MNTNIIQREPREQRREDERLSGLDAHLFRDTPLVSPTVASWGNVPGHLLLRTDEKRVPSPKAFAEVVWTGVPRHLPAIPPPAPSNSDDYKERADAQLVWWAKVRSWRDACDPAMLGRSWLLSGAPGTGKTRASIARAQVWSLATGVEAMPLSSRDYSRSYEQTRIAFVRGVEFAPAAVAEARGEHSDINGVSELSRLNGVPFLVLDDVDAGNWTPVAIGALYNLVDSRLNMQLPTMLSFNGTAQNWLNRIASRYPDECIMVEKILRRIRDLCGAPVVFGLAA